MIDLVQLQRCLQTTAERPRGIWRLTLCKCSHPSSFASVNRTRGYVVKQRDSFKVALFSLHGLTRCSFLARASQLRPGLVNVTAFVCNGFAHWSLRPHFRKTSPSRGEACRVAQARPKSSDIFHSLCTQMSRRLHRPRSWRCIYCTTSFSVAEPTKCRPKAVSLGIGLRPPQHLDCINARSEILHDHLSSLCGNRHPLSRRKGVKPIVADNHNLKM